MLRQKIDAAHPQAPLLLKGSSHVLGRAQGATGSGQALLTRIGSEPGSIRRSAILGSMGSPAKKERHVLPPNGAAAARSEQGADGRMPRVVFSAAEAAERCLFWPCLIVGLWRAPLLSV